MPMFFYSIFKVIVILGYLQGIDSLSPKGNNVCARECEKLQWKTRVLLRACGNSNPSTRCRVFKREPQIYKSVCYECCHGWRDSDGMNCNTPCHTGVESISTCLHLADGWYQLCDDCDRFAYCQLGAISRLDCPGYLKWDDYSKKCVNHSRTCEDSNIIDPFTGSVAINSVSQDRDLFNELTNKVDIFDTSVCSQIKCHYPGQCIPVYSNSIFLLEPKCVCPAGMKLKKKKHNEFKCKSINECDKNPCMHGVCVERKRGYTCHCDVAWRGRHCHKIKRQRRYKFRHKVYTHKPPYKDIRDNEWGAPNTFDV